ncbi:MAG: hypothetical protein V3U28_10675 [Candidatus Acidoferrales bacterium]
MAKSYETFQKRQKERARQEKARLKRERREQRRGQKNEPDFHQPKDQAAQS